MKNPYEQQSEDSRRPTFRNPDLYQVLPWREWFRNNIPSAQAGYVVEDLDLLVLRYGPIINRGKRDDGIFILCEVKTNGASMGYAQERVWSLVHKILRRGDPGKKHYHGFYLIEWENGPDSDDLVTQTAEMIGETPEYIRECLNVARIYNGVKAHQNPSDVSINGVQVGIDGLKDFITNGKISDGIDIESMFD